MLYDTLEAGGTKMVLSVGNEQNELLEQIFIPTEAPEVTIPAMIDWLFYCFHCRKLRFFFCRFHCRKFRLFFREFRRLRLFFCLLCGTHWECLP